MHLLMNPRLSPHLHACSSTSSSASSASSSASSTLALQATGTKGECPNCRAALTPMRPHLTLHFKKLLQKKNAAKGTNSRKRVKPQYYGEALTSDKVFKRLRADKESQKQPSKKKRRKSPSPVTEEAVLPLMRVKWRKVIKYRGIEHFYPSVNTFCTSRLLPS